MAKRKSYSKRAFDKMSLDIIQAGKDIEFVYQGRKYTIDIKEYEAKLRFERPELFKK